MDINQLSKILNDPSAIAALSDAELNQWIDAYPYVYRLHEIKAQRVGSTADSEHVITMTGAGWLADDLEQHEFVTLEEAVPDEASAGALDSEEQEPTASNREESPSPIKEPDAAETHDDQVPVIEDVAAAAVDNVVVETVTVQFDESLMEEEVSAEEDMDEENVAATLAMQEEYADAGDKAQDEPMDEVEFMGEDEEAPTEPQPLAVPDIEEPKLVIEDAEKESLEASGNVLMMVSGKAAQKKKKKDKKKSKDEAQKKKKKSKGDGGEKKTKKKKETKKKKGKKKLEGPKNVDEQKVKKKKKKDGKKKASLTASNYAEWLLAQEQINKKKAKKKKKKKKQKKVVQEAMRSLTKKKGIVSEPLAELLVAQGHVPQAIMMYQELSLMHPKKSTYFAARIKELKNNS